MPPKHIATQTRTPASIWLVPVTTGSFALTAVAGAASQQYTLLVSLFMNVLSLLSAIAWATAATMSMASDDEKKTTTKKKWLSKSNLWNFIAALLTGMAALFQVFAHNAFLPK
jgi:hypothetical protein